MTLLQLLDDTYELALRTVGAERLPPAVAARTVSAIEHLDATSRGPEAPCRDALLLAGTPTGWPSVDAEREAVLDRRMSALRGCSAVVFTDGAEPAPAVQRAAARHHIVLLVSSAPPAAWERAAAHVREDRLRESEEYARWVTELVGFRPSPGVAHRMTRWLAGKLGSQAAVIDTVTGHVWAAEPDGAPEAVSAALGADSDERTPVSVHGMPGLGESVVLAVLHERSPTPREQDLIKVSGDAMTTHIGTVWDQSHRTELSQGAFQALMMGHEELARRILVDAAPRMLDTERAVVRVIEVGEAVERQSVIGACRRADPESLTVPCPANPREVITTRFLHTRTPRTDVLEPFVERTPELRMGVSLVHPLSALLTGYLEGSRALERARFRDESIVAYADMREWDILTALDQAAAYRWAVARLAPVLTQARRVETRLQLLGHVLVHGVSGTAGMVGLHPDTVSDTVRADARLLGLDLRRTAHRALLHLALTVYGAATSDRALPDAAPPRLADVLATSAARGWAEAILDPLDSERHLPVIGWWASAQPGQAGIELAAGQLDISVATVRRRLREASNRLEVRLTERRGPVLPIVLACHTFTGRPALADASAQVQSD